ncbi:MAG: ABC transporter ATP-binding protein [Acidobacteriota bacterium]
MQAAIQVSNLHKSYDAFEAVKGIDFEVQQGEIFGLLGPNGAGKTTTVEILEGLRPRTSGDVKVLGYDPGIDVKAVKQRIGVCLQSTNLPDNLKVHEALSWFAAFYDQNSDRDALLKRLQLWDKRNDFYSKLSGGQKQRVALALAMVNQPEMIFLDEPTTGLDPQVRLEIHGIIEELRAAKRTVLLTTHYIEEAERLCDRVAIIDQGKIIAIGSPREIQEKTLGESRIVVSTNAPMPRTLPAFEATVRAVPSDDLKSLTLLSTRPGRTLADVVRWIDQSGLELEDVHLKRPTLEDVFIELTGKKLRD